MVTEKSSTPTEEKQVLVVWIPGLREKSTER